ncbi:hypothetical protein EXN66_Car004234 [Channa argus]|uniref:Uncharacterized protein n=1 Tax=Channa argus TaxID=215402 RepID=A0A6G1PE92_CHAAH|nr:hypothetical protein EXN66_Car004234 [Channa argus]
MQSDIFSNMVQPGMKSRLWQLTCKAAGFQLVDEEVGPLVVRAAVAKEDMGTFTIVQCGGNKRSEKQEWVRRL